MIIYIAQIWNQQLTENKDPTIILPIVIYHGETTFQYKKIIDFFENIDDDLKQFIPNFEYLVTDLNEFSEEELIMFNLGILLSTFLVFKHKRDWNFVHEQVQVLFNYERHEYEEFVLNRFSIAFFSYLWIAYDITEEQWNKFQKNIPTNLNDTAMSFYDTIIQKGEVRGEARGETKTTTKFTIQVIQQFPDWSDEQVAKLVDVTVEFVQNIRKDLEEK